VDFLPLYVASSLRAFRGQVLCTCSTAEMSTKTFRLFKLRTIRFLEISESKYPVTKRQIHQEPNQQLHHLENFEARTSFGISAKIKEFLIKLTNQNYIHESVESS
jgi:hypothetical protein